MLEHDCDTDEDCEVYFLKPVNEYNIVDKIKEANKELFEEGDSSENPPEQKRKVQFRVNLEEYEPGSTEAANANGFEKESAEDGCYELLTLDEEPEDISVPSNQTIEQCAEMLAMEVQKKIEAIEIKITESDEDIEEICEVIEVMDMDTGRRLDGDTKEINSTRDEPRDTSTDSDVNELKDDESAEVADVTEEPPEDADDDDDKLSIIVASYLPPDPPACEDKCSGTKKKPFSRHFSFRRRKANCRSPEIANIKMNYKTCCEYRNSEGIRLPKYSGYMSEYGLSREQLQKREHSLQNKHKVVAEKSLKATEAEVKKMQDNERAFTTWLKNKMRFPINRTKNMFDVKKANNCTVGGKSGIFRQK